MPRTVAYAIGDRPSPCISIEDIEKFLIEAEVGIADRAIALTALGNGLRVTIHGEHRFIPIGSGLYCCFILHH